MRKNERIEQHPQKQDCGKDDDKHPGATKRGHLIGKSLSKSQLFFKLPIGITADMPTFTVMVNHSLFRFRERIEVNSKPFLGKISQVLVHGGTL
jgi:hypothetical protein